MDGSGPGVCVGGWVTGGGATFGEHAAKSSPHRVAAKTMEVIVLRIITKVEIESGCSGKGNKQQEKPELIPCFKSRRLHCDTCIAERRMDSNREFQGMGPVAVQANCFGNQVDVFTVYACNALIINYLQGL